MSEKPTVVLMNSDELFAMRPSTKIDRWLIRGELRESKVTKRNPNHSGAIMTLAKLLGVWLDTRPKPRGKLYGAEAYFRIRKDPDTNVGIDVALASPDQKVATGKRSKFVDGPPTLAVEVLSPYDKQIEIDEKISEYLDCGVKVVWIVDPMDETVTVYRPGENPTMYNAGQDLPGGPELPKFRCRVADIFE